MAVTFALARDTFIQTSFTGVVGIRTTAGVVSLPIDIAEERIGFG